MMTVRTKSLRKNACEKLNERIADMLTQQHKPYFIEWYVTKDGEVITEELVDQNSRLDRDDIRAIVKFGCGSVSCDCDWCSGENAVKSVDDIEFDSEEYAHMKSLVDENLGEVPVGFFDDETFTCAGCAEEVSDNFNGDDAEYAGATGCGTCGMKFCGECAEDLVLLSSLYDASSFICIHCRPEAFIESITIASGDEVRLVGEHAPLHDEYDEETSYFSAFLTHYETVLQDEFKYADIRFDKNASRDQFEPSVDIDAFCSIKERIQQCWRKAIDTFEV